MIEVSRKINRGMGLAEIAVAVLVGAVGVIPILWVVSSTRTETTKAINYLRALELANEIIDLANVVPAQQLSSFEGVFSQSLKPMQARFPNGDYTGNFTQAQLDHSQDYGQAYYYRNIKVETFPPDSYRRFLTKLTVSIEWNEAKKPDNENNNTGSNARMRKVVLETLLNNEFEPNY